MIAALTAFWTRAIMPYVAIALGGLALFGSVLFAGRRQGRIEAERRALGRDLEVRETRDAIDRSANRERDPAQRLRDKWSRD
jgi:hypothetical protein